jgi:hypothetical protein
VALLDDFNRANENPLGVPWADMDFWDNLQVVSNECAGTTGTSNAMIYDVDFGADHEAEATLVNKVTDRYQGTWVRAAADGSGYFGATITRAGTDEWEIWEIDNAGGGAAIAGPVALEWNAGDKIRTRAIGSTISVWRFDGATWTEVASATDATLATGRIGIYENDTSVRLDDFSGGAVVVGVVPLPRILRSGLRTA